MQPIAAQMHPFQEYPGAKPDANQFTENYQHFMDNQNYDKETPLMSLQKSLEKKGFLSSSPSRSENETELKSEEEEFEDESIDVPKLNSHGKLKKHKCKQCNFVCLTKVEFWEHSKLHIREDRLLTCPKCPFVTEYKHHLEYHLRNHSGSKPFKCDSCNYSCVNKSMLNSHKKSHSKVYQYRCADCSYATKYCHSLKLHLRKYSHKPAMVLNPDGTPNPLPIIDVYGTRRGPKMKTNVQKDTSQMLRPEDVARHQFMNMLMPAAAGFPFGFPAFSPIQNLLAMQFQALHGKNPFEPTVNITEKDMSASNQEEVKSRCEFPKTQQFDSQFENRLEMPMDTKPWGNSPSRNESARLDQNRFDQNKFDQERLDKNKFDQDRFDQNKFDQERFDQSKFDQERFDQNRFVTNKFDPANIDASKLDTSKFDTPKFDRSKYDTSKIDLTKFDQSKLESNSFDQVKPGTPNKFDSPVQRSEEIQTGLITPPEDKPLDLTYQNITPIRALQGLMTPVLNAWNLMHNTPQSAFLMKPQDREDVSSPMSTDSSETPKETCEIQQTPIVQLGSSRRRKGVAVRRAPSEIGAEDTANNNKINLNPMETIESNEIDRIDGLSDTSSRRTSIDSESSESKAKTPKDDSHECKYCGIDFGDVILYSMHMGYHGFKEPFTCNMCGEQCKDKVSFNLHIARTKHN